MSAGRVSLIFHSLLLASCVLDFLTTQYLLEHQLAQEANPSALLEFNEMAMTSIVVFAICSALFHVSTRVLREFDEPEAESRTVADLMGAINRRPIMSVAVGLVPLPLVILILKLMAGVDNLLLIVLDENVASVLRQRLLHLTTAEFFMLSIVVCGSILYVIICIWLFRRWQRTGAFTHGRAR